MDTDHSCIYTCLLSITRKDSCAMRICRLETHIYSRIHTVEYMWYVLLSYSAGNYLLLLHMYLRRYSTLVGCLSFMRALSSYLRTISLEMLRLPAISLRVRLPLPSSPNLCLITRFSLGFRESSCMHNVPMHQW